LFDLALGTLDAAQITDLSNPLIGLRLTDTAIGAFADVLGVDFASGTRFADAATAPQFGGQVPAPGGSGLILGALGFGLLRRRRKASGDRRRAATSC